MTVSLTSLQAGDFEAWRQLTENLAPKLRTLIKYRLPWVDLAVNEDLQSDVFSWLVKKVGESFFKDINHLEATAIVKTRYLCIDYIRNKRNQTSSLNIDVEDDEDGFVSLPYEQPDPNPNPLSEEESEIELAEILMRLLESIPTKQRAVLKLVYLDGKTQQQTADLLGMPIGSVGVYCTRGLDNIRAELKKHPHLLPDASATLKPQLLASLILMLSLMQ